MSGDERKEYLTVEDVADELGVSVPTAWNYLRQSGVQRYHIPGRGKRTFIARRDLPKVLKPRPVERKPERERST